MPSSVGDTYCTNAVPNSTGQPGAIGARGSILVADDELVLHASQLPQNVAGFFLTSRTQGFVANPGGSTGNLCLSGTIGRFSLFVQNSGAAGTIELALHLGSIPSPTGSVAIAPGDTWNFQAWHRDGASSNFTDAVAETFA